MSHEIGHVKPGDYRRGQGGLFCRTENPFNTVTAPDAFLNSFERKKTLEIG